MLSSVDSILNTNRYPSTSVVTCVLSSVDRIGVQYNTLNTDRHPLASMLHDLCALNVKALNTDSC